MKIFSYSWKITSIGQVKNVHQHVPLLKDASKEIRESVKATEAEETDSGDEMNDDDDDVVIL